MLPTTPSDVGTARQILGDFLEEREPSPTEVRQRAATSLIDAFARLCRDLGFAVDAPEPAVLTVRRPGGGPTARVLAAEGQLSVESIGRGGSATWPELRLRFNRVTQALEGLDPEALVPPHPGDPGPSRPALVVLAETVRAALSG